jgi:hypothetical protein
LLRELQYTIMMVVRQNRTHNRRTGLVARVTEDLFNASSDRDSRPKDDLDSAILDRSLFNLSSSDSSLLSHVDLTPHTEWDESRARKKKNGHTSTNNEMVAEAGDGKLRPSEKKARAPASLWKAVMKEVMGSSVVHQQSESESELKVKNKNNFASHISAPADLNDANFFPKGGDESGADRSSEKKARTHALWNAIKKEVMGSSMHQIESELRRKNEADQAANVGTENAGTAESESKDNGEQGDRSLEKKARASALWKKVTKKEIMGLGVNKEQGLNEALNKSSRGLFSNNRSMKNARKHSSLLDLTQPQENRINTPEGLGETKSQLGEYEKRTITKAKRVDLRLLFKKALSVPLLDKGNILPIENEARDFDDGNIIGSDTIEKLASSESKSFERLQSLVKEVESIFTGDDGEERVGDSRHAAKSPAKHLARRGLASRSNPRRGRRSHYRRAISDPSVTVNYDQPRDMEGKCRSIRGEENRINTPEGLEETKSQLSEYEKRAITKAKRVDLRLLFKKALSVPLLDKGNILPIENEARDFDDGDIIGSDTIEKLASSEESKSFERLQSLAKEAESIFAGDDGEETVGDSRLAAKSPAKHLARRGSASRSNPRRGHRSHYRKAISDPSLTVDYDQPRDMGGKCRSDCGEDSREEAMQCSSGEDPANRSEKQQTKREERSPRRGRRSQFRKAGSEPTLLADSTSWESSETFECWPPDEMKKESRPLRDGDAREVKQYGARDAWKRPSKQLRKGGEGRRDRTPTSGRRSQLRRTASDRTSKVVTSMEKLEILFSGHKSTTAIEIFSQSPASANEVKDEAPLFASLNSFLSAQKIEEERRRTPSFDDTSLDEDSTINSMEV